MSRVALFSIVGVCAAGLATGIVVRSILLREERIAIYPPVVEIGEPHMQGQPLEVQLELKNESRTPVTITSLSTTCGCMVLSGKDGPLKTPFLLKQGAVFPISLGIGTANRLGRQTFGLTVVSQGSQGSPKSETTATVRVNVLAALSAEPATIIFRRAKVGAQLAAEVKLADALPDPGVRIREIKVSNEKTMRVEIQPDSGPSLLFGESDTARARGTLKLSYVPDAAQGRIQEMISIVPENQQYPVLEIPVYCEMAEQPFRFLPPGLTILDSGDQGFRRKIAFDSDDAEAAVSVLRSPPGIQVEVGESSPSRKLITISGDSSALAQKSCEIVFLVNGEEVTLPIRVSSSN